MSEIDDVRKALEEIERDYKLRAEHRALLAIARAALARWSSVKDQLDAMKGKFETPGRYEGSTKVTALLGQEVKLRNAVLASIEKIARLLN